MFKGGTEEAIRFTADKDCDVILSDRTNGGISLVGSVTGHSTDFTVVDGAKTDIITRIYKNGSGVRQALSAFSHIASKRLR